MITIPRLVFAGIHITQARLFAEPLGAACERFEINTPARISAFLAQCMVESGKFTALEESMFYTKPERILRIFSSRVADLEHATSLARNPKRMANCVYAFKNGNGDEASGDGYRFIGRGLIQITGRTKYTAASADLGRAYLEVPDLVAEPEDACLTAGWYWHTNKLNALADASAIDAITRAVNGPAMVEAGLRRQYSEEARVAFA